MRAPVRMNLAGEAVILHPPPQMVLLTTDFKPLTGGIAAYLHHLCESAALDAPVTVYSTVSTNGESWERHYVHRVLRAVPPRQVGTMVGDRFPSIRRFHTACHFLRHRRSAARLVRALVRDHGHTAAYYIGLWNLESHFWCAALRRQGLSYTLIAHGLEVVAPLYGRLPHWRRADFMGAARIIGPSHATADVVRKRIGQRNGIVVVHPGVELSGAVTDEARRLARVRLAVEDRVVLLSLGRLVRRKGVDLALHRVAELRGRFPSLCFLIAGDGPERGSLEALARQLGLAASVRFLGAVDDAARGDLYAASDVFVTLNRELGGTDFEGFGIVFLEAGLAECPVVGGRNGGVVDAIEDGVTGLLVDPENAGETRAALERLLADGGLRQRMGRAGRERALTKFSWDASGTRFRMLRKEETHGER